MRSVWQHRIVRNAIWMVVLAGASSAGGPAVLAQETPADTVRPNRGFRAVTRSVYVATHDERAPAGLQQLLRARRIRNPLLVVDGVVMNVPAPVDVQQHSIECVELRPGRTATLEYRRGRIDDGTDGLVLIWTRGSPEPKPRDCRIDD